MTYRVDSDGVMTLDGIKTYDSDVYILELGLYTVDNLQERYVGDTCLWDLQYQIAASLAYVNRASQTTILRKRPVCAQSLQNRALEIQ